MTNHSTLRPKHLPRSARGYSQWWLELYDALILSLSARWVWGCPPQYMTALYKHYVSRRHLELGVGTGYFLNQGCFPTLTPQLTLLDVNPRVLQFAERRLARYRPKLVVLDVLHPDWVGVDIYQSVGMNLVWHALDATSLQRQQLLARIASHLENDGVLFGSTVLGLHDGMSKLAKRMSRHWVKVGLFYNQGQTAAQLRLELEQAFAQVRVWQVGEVVQFHAQHPKRPPPQPTRV